MRKPGGEDELDDRGDDQEDLVGQGGDCHEMLVRKEEQVNDQEKLFNSKEQAGGTEVHVGRCC